VGQEVEVMVLAINKKKERISLSFKQAQPDPWQFKAEDYKVGHIMEGEITKIAPKYIFIKLEPGIEGLVPLNEASEDKNARLDELFTIGSKIPVKILDVKTCTEENDSEYKTGKRGKKGKGICILSNTSGK
jgi:ribosomal protein S1